MLVATEPPQQPAHDDDAVAAPRHRTLAIVAADRARALREQAAAIRSDRLQPLRAALHIRAAELELAATALGDEPVAARQTA